MRLVIKETKDGGLQVTVVRQTAKSLARRMAGMERGDRQVEGMTINLDEIQKREGACEDG